MGERAGVGASFWDLFLIAVVSFSVFAHHVLHARLREDGLKTCRRLV